MSADLAVGVVLRQKHVHAVTSASAILVVSGIGTQLFDQESCKATLFDNFEIGKGYSNSR